MERLLREGSGNVNGGRGGGGITLSPDGVKLLCVLPLGSETKQLINISHADLTSVFYDVHGGGGCIRGVLVCLV